MRRILLGGLAVLAIFGAAGLAGARSAAAAPPKVSAEAPVTVFAAASLAEAMNRLASAWEARGHAKPSVSFASSAVLARQIGAGAPAALFISADETWMDWVAARNLLAPDTRRDLLGNTLVLVEPRATLKPVRIGPGFDLAAVLGPDGRLAVGDPASVPAGIYARQALTALGSWDAASKRLAPAENVRAALLLVQRGEAPAGIVYGSDVLASPDLAVAGTFPENSHPPIRYPVAALKGAGETTEARALLGFLEGPDAAPVFAKAGFAVLPH